MCAPIKVFVINLAKDVAKYQRMEAICRAMGFDFEIFPAVNGNKLSQIEIDKGYSEEDSIKKMGRPLARAEIGCAFSHI
ncbi:MAG: glycosyltransferase family 25 protein, partial [Prolixibacteraceae bacterium]|nr:glycosyltransferase family 25 protein [Prolixibacteraceae bacterium]